MHDVAAILLAAGRSRRMGAFKPLLPFGNETVIESCIDSLQAGGVGQIVVVLGHRAAEVRRHLNHRKLSFAVNPDPDREMSASIACGIQEVSQSAKTTLIALVDHPAVPAEVITGMIEKWKAGARLIIPQFGGRGGHPVLIDLAWREELLQIDPTRGLRALFEAHKAEVCRLPVLSPFVARDMDTWEDYARLHRDVFGKPPEPAK
ncbi:MAG: molybdenum cofactor cytidylyltransferase [Blastocatellia bacterium]|jgi:molybdenum cofactor cytidylyltransferase|nr:molybdenum cofactor cytidylyltransferase [Blastocatellia bacterium]